ncbi:MAG: LptF/LptG family permease [Armatimonadota bacterium]
MKRLDRYVLTEMVPPFLFGIGAFLAVLVGVQLLYEMLRLIYQQGFPAWAALRIFFLELPAFITLTLPMATVFGSLMAMARLSSDGELVAMRAGGISIPRIALPIVIAGLVISVVGVTVNETVVPAAKQRSFEIARDVHSTVGAERDLALEIRDDEDHFERFVHAREFDPDNLTLRDATVLDFTLGPRPELYTAKMARWQGQYLILENVEYTRWEDDQQYQARLPRMMIPIGRTPEDVERVRKLPDDMSLAELQEQARRADEQGLQAWAHRLRQHYQVRLALPWACVGFAVLGVALGIQRHRSSRGIGMGISLLVIFVYYVIMHTLTLVGERGVAHPALMAWTPNALLYLVGTGLLARRAA